MARILVPYHLDENLPSLDVPYEPDRTVTADLPDGGPWQRMAALYDDVANVVAHDVRSGGRPVVMSGDCTTSLATVAGLQRAGVDPAIVWFDGHGDVQTLETTTSGYLGGMPLRILTGYRPELISDDLGLRTIPEARVVLVDARDLDLTEAEFLTTSAVRRCDVEDLVANVIPAGPLYLHIDFDVVTPDELPGLLFPAAGGPGLDAVGAAIGRVIATGRVAAVGVGCTWHAGHGNAARVRPLLDEARVA
ncbi:MAG TPA: arginase family protein [Jiangellaceae bacterium]